MNHTNKSLQIEKQFAVKAVQHMLTYWKILEQMRGSTLKLTKYDDEIYEHFMKEFPDFDPSATIIEDEMKSKAGKERWRKFIMAYEKTIEDYNFGTMLRNSHATEYNEKDTIFGTSTLALCAGDQANTQQRCACNSMQSRSFGKNHLPLISRP
jgi:hypothetical protein